MKLISMTKFVLNINELVPKDSDQFFDSWRNKKLSIIENYSNFLETQLRLEMFIPLNEYGEVLDKPIEKNFTDGTGFVNNAFFIETNDYLKAQEKVLLEGFSLRIDDDLKVLLHDETKCVRTFFNFNDAFKGMKVEDMVHKNYELTPNAIKRIFG